MSRIYRYVLMNDGGMAPCPDNGWLTLATCKPGIRKTAKQGDWVIGNFPSPNNELVAWAGRVQHTMSVGDYGTAHLLDRKDALYPNDSNGVPHRDPRKLPGYHPTCDHIRKDTTGEVLIFDAEATWYFGGDGREIPQELAHIIKRGIGYTYKGSHDGDETRLIEWLRTQGPPGRFGAPREPYQDPTSPGCGLSPKRRKKPKPKSC